MSKLFRITGFQNNEAPHWEVAFIEAEVSEEARDILLSKIGRPDDDRGKRPDTVWGVTDSSDWHVEEVGHPFVFILGGGCR